MVMIRKRDRARPFHEVKLWCARFENLCRDRGIRVTSQRLAVYRALAADPTHPTADSLYAKLRPKMSWLSLATVYRILESLEHEGFIRRVSTTNGAARFDANLTPHQHLVCRHCGRMMDFHDESLSGLKPTGQWSTGFGAEEIEIRIIGSCEDCRRTRLEAAPKQRMNKS